MNIDINFLRGISTVLVMIGFTGITLWAYSSKRKVEFNQAAQIPFLLDKEPDEDESVVNEVKVVIDHE